MRRRNSDTILLGGSTPLESSPIAPVSTAAAPAGEASLGDRTRAVSSDAHLALRSAASVVGYRRRPNLTRTAELAEPSRELADISVQIADAPGIQGSPPRFGIWTPRNGGKTPRLRYGSDASARRSGGGDTPTSDAMLSRAFMAHKLFQVRTHAAPASLLARGCTYTSSL
jgi:hypothetical protein